MHKGRNTAKGLKDEKELPGAESEGLSSPDSGIHTYGPGGIHVLLLGLRSPNLSARSTTACLIPML